jgi:hypothetical protein
MPQVGALAITCSQRTKRFDASLMVALTASHVSRKFKVNVASRTSQGCVALNYYCCGFYRGTGRDEVVVIRELIEAECLSSCADWAAMGERVDGLLRLGLRLDD